MTGLDPNLTFALGFGACAVFIAVAELGAQIIQHRRARRIMRLRLDSIAIDLEAEVAAMMAEARGPCPWPLNLEGSRGPHRISENKLFHASQHTERES